MIVLICSHGGHWKSRVTSAGKNSFRLPLSCLLSTASQQSLDIFSSVGFFYFPLISIFSHTYYIRKCFFKCPLQVHRVGSIKPEKGVLFLVSHEASLMKGDPRLCSGKLLAPLWKGGLAAWPWPCKSQGSQSRSPS